MLGVCDPNRPFDESEFVKKFVPPDKLNINTTGYEKGTQQQYKLGHTFKRDEAARPGQLCQEYYYHP